jgi:hypothetical protein
MELDELEPTGYFSEFSWVSTEDEEEDTVTQVDGEYIFAASQPSHALTTDIPAMPVAEKQEVTRR